MKRIIKITSLFIVPSFLSLGFYSSCSKKSTDPEKVTPKIVCPIDQQKTQKLILDDGFTSILYKNFTFSGFEVENPDEIFVNMQGFENYAVSCRGSLTKKVVNFNKDLRTFDIEVNFINVKPSTEIIATPFAFYYQTTSIPTDSNNFNVLLSGNATSPEIFHPQEHSFNLECASGTFSKKIEGFKYKGFTDIKQLEAIPVFDESLGNFKCYIEKAESYQEQFNVYLYGWNVSLGKTITGKINFKLNGSVIKSDSDNYLIELFNESSVPDFRTDDWWQIAKCARTQGIEGLQKRYHINSFVGLKKIIPITINEKTINHTVTVIGQSHDTLYNQKTLEGEKASLTFAFDQVLTFEQSSDGYSSSYDAYKHRWNDKQSNDWNENVISETGHSEIRYWLNNEFKDKIMPYEISGYLPKVAKKTTFFSSKSIVTSNDYIFLPSICEFGAVIDNDSVLNQEGVCYQYFDQNKTNNASKLRMKTQVNATKYENYCFRSPSLDKQTLVYGCQNGSIVLDPYLFNVDQLNCIAPCFCL